MRLFIAFPLAVDVKRELDRAIGELARKISGVKWVSAENLHLTVRFLGETSHDKLPLITSLIHNATVGHAAVSGKLAQSIGAFPSLIRPRAIWAGIVGIAGAAPLVERIEQKICEYGFEPERKGWSPHVTLGRVRDGVQIDSRPLTEVRLPPLSVTLHQLILYESRLSPSGPSYQPLATATLGEERFS